MDLASIEKVLHIQNRLSETLTWCASKNWAINPAEELRTMLLCPVKHANIKKTFFDYDRFWKKTPQQKQQIIEEFTAKRAELLRAQNVTLIQLQLPLTSGRLLAFDPNGSTSDGAADFATKGFFDYDNIPAWDTWIAYVTNDPVNNAPWHSLDSYLLSWVPEPLVDVVEKGINVNWEECILWAKDIDSVFIRQLQQAGLVV